MGSFDATSTGEVEYADGPGGDLAVRLKSEIMLIDASSFADTLRALVGQNLTVHLKINLDPVDDFDPLIQLGELGESVETNTFGLRYREGFAEILTETGEGNDNLLALAPRPPSTEWVAISWVFEEDLVEYYVDGELVASDLFIPPETTTNRLFLGSESTGVAKMEGWIDEIRVWGEALSADQIAEL